MSPAGLPPLILTTPQASIVYGRSGLRAEASDTYFEAGLEEIDSQNVLQRYVFANVPGVIGGTLYCEPAAAVQLTCGTSSVLHSPLNATAISNESGLANRSFTLKAPETGDFLNAGFYVNFNLKFALWSRRDAAGADQSWYLMVANKSDFYFNSHTDTTVQTRYLDKLSPSLVIPIYGRLSLMPRVDIITYENKVNRYHYRALEPSLSLNYSFDWREGMSRSSALRYGAITTPSPGAH